MASDGLTGEPSTKDKAKSEAGAVGHEATEAGRRVADVAKSEVKGTAQEAAAQARNLGSELVSGLKSQASTQQGKLGEGIRSLSEELRSMASSTENGTASNLVNQVADKAGDVAGWIEGREPSDLLEEVKSFARRRPGAFLAIAAGAGLVAGRLTRGLAGGQETGTTSTPQHLAPATPAVVPPPPAYDPMLDAEPVAGYGTQEGVAVPPLDTPVGLNQPPVAGTPDYDPTIGR